MSILQLYDHIVHSKRHSLRAHDKIRISIKPAQEKQREDIWEVHSILNYLSIQTNPTLSLSFQKFALTLSLYPKVIVLQAT